MIVRNPLAYSPWLLNIRTKAGTVAPLRFNPIQRKILAAKRKAFAAGAGYRFIILKSRRSGVSTEEQAVNYATTAWRENQLAVTLSNTDKSAEIMFRAVELMYRMTPLGFRPRRLTEHNKGELNFPDRGSMYYTGTAGSRGFGRGSGLQRAHLAEMAHWRIDTATANDLLAGVTEATSHGEVTIESTPRGVGGLFHETWAGAERGTNGWTPLFFPWWDDSDNAVAVPPDFQPTEEEIHFAKQRGLTMEQIAWKRAKVMELKHLFPQEYPEDPATCFLTSGSCFFDTMAISKLLNEIPPPPPHPGGPQTIRWAKPVPGRRYVAGGDTSGGKPDGDDAVLSVLDYETMEQVAVLRGKIPPREFGRLSVALCVEYNKALLAIERENHGNTVIHVVVTELGYENVYHYVDVDGTGQQKREAGWTTNGKTRPVLLDELQEAIEQGFMRVRDRVLLQECLTFEMDGGKWQAREGCHDDTIFANGIAVQARKAHSQNKTEVSASYAARAQNASPLAQSSMSRYFPGRRRIF